MRIKLFLLISILVLATQAVGVPTANSADYWPTDRWRASTPEEQGIDSSKLADALDYISQHEVNIHSLVIIRNGYLVLDANFFPYDGRTLHDVASVTKSVTSTLIGVAIKQGKIDSVAEPVTRIFSTTAQADKDTRKERMTIASLLSMTSGLHCEYKESELTLRQMKESSNWTNYMLNLPMADEPGKKFVYCSGGMHLLSGIISHATGSSSLDLAQTSVFRPLGIEQTAWPADPQGVNHGWGDLRLYPKDMAKIGYLWLNNGVWDGNQVLPRNWMEEATRPQIRQSGDTDYGYGFWIRRSEGLYEALGRGGQRISIVPSKNLVVVFTGGGFEPSDIGKILTGAVSDKPLPANRSANEHLALALRKAALPPQPKAVAALPAIADRVSGRSYEFGDNPLGLKSLSLKFPAGPEASIRFTFLDTRFTENKTSERAVGLDGVLRLSAGGRFGSPVGLRGFWENKDTFVFDYDEIANINCYRFTMTFANDRVSIQISERTGMAKLDLTGTAK